MATHSGNQGLIRNDEPEYQDLMDLPRSSIPYQPRLCFAKRAHRAAPVPTAQALAPNGQIGSGDIFGRQRSSIVYGDVYGDQGPDPSKQTRWARAGSAPFRTADQAWQPDSLRARSPLRSGPYSDAGARPMESPRNTFSASTRCLLLRQFVGRQSQWPADRPAPHSMPGWPRNSLRRAGIPRPHASHVA